MWWWGGGGGGGGGGWIYPCGEDTLQELCTFLLEEFKGVTCDSPGRMDKVEHALQNICVSTSLSTSPCIIMTHDTVKEIAGE